MKTIYFKITKPEEYWNIPIYYKIAEKEGSSAEVNIFPGSIDFNNDTGDSFDERVRILLDRRKYNEKIIRVDREEFDMVYKRIVERLNSITVL